MLRLVFRGFAQRKLRVALTAISIVLGVALMAGTYILTDTINNSFAAIFQTASKGHDVVVSPAEQLGREMRSQTSPVTQQMVEQVRRTQGVAQASGSIFSEGTFLDYTPQTAHERLRSSLHRLDRATPLRVLRAGQRPLPDHLERGRDRRGHIRTLGTRHRQQMIVAGLGGDRPLHDRRHPSASAAANPSAAPVPR